VYPRCLMSASNAAASSSPSEIVKRSIGPP